MPSHGGLRTQLECRQLQLYENITSLKMIFVIRSECLCVEAYGQTQMLLQNIHVLMRVQGAPLAN